MPEIHTARGLLDSVQGISARDALHVAVMRSAGITRIFSYDAGFDSVPGIERLE
jgi:predicted nucleic acid-binding protein